jgi:glyoxylase-like metal-dependent hydrolase (beta-lactamase superfamily II)
MKTKIAVVAACAALLVAAPRAQNQGGELEVLHVKGNIYAIFGAGGNVVVSVGKDGAFIVDTGMPQNAEKLLAAIQKLQRDVQAKEAAATP